MLGMLSIDPVNAVSKLFVKDRFYRLWVLSIYPVNDVSKLFEKDIDVRLGVLSIDPVNAVSKLFEKYRVIRLGVLSIEPVNAESKLFEKDRFLMLGVLSIDPGAANNWAQTRIAPTAISTENSNADAFAPDRKRLPGTGAVGCICLTPPVFDATLWMTFTGFMSWLGNEKTLV